MKLKVKPEYRELSFREAEINEEEQTVEVSFSSEAAVERWFGMEILDHTNGGHNFDRLNNAAAVMVDHWSDQVGKVVKAWIDNGIGRAVLQFSRSRRGKEVFQDIMDGIRQNVSVGYMIDKLTLDRKENDKEFYRAAWTPFEISIVSVPADYKIGVGRNAELETEIEVEGKEEVKDYSRIDATIKINENIMAL